MSIQATADFQRVCTENMSGARYIETQLFAVERNLETATQLAYANVKKATQSAAKELIQHFDADKSDQPGNADQLINSVALSVYTVDFETEVAIDLGG